MSGIAPVGITTATNIRPSFRGESCQQVCDDGSCSVVCPPEEKKHGSVLGFIVKTLLTAGIVAGGLVLARKNIGALKGDLATLEKDTTFLGKVKLYTAKAGDFVEEQWNKLVKLVKREETKPADGEAKPTEGEAKPAEDKPAEAKPEEKPAEEKK